MCTTRFAQGIIIEMGDEMFGSEQVLLDCLRILPVRFIVNVVNASLNTAAIASDVSDTVDDVLVRESSIDTLCRSSVDTLVLFPFLGSY